MHYTRWNLSWEDSPKEHNLPRRTLHWLIAERTGHGDYQQYHKRFKHAGAESRCRCGNIREARHFAECDLTRGKLPECPDGYEDITTYLLGPKGSIHFQKLVEETNLYEPRM